MVRVTTNSLTKEILSDLNRNLVRYSELQGRLSSGKRIESASDDPSSFALALRLRSSYYTDIRYEENIERAKSFLDITESTISAISDAVGEIITTAQTAGDGALSDDARYALADEVRETLNQIIQLANTTFGSTYIFAGNETQNAPFSEVAGYSQTSAVKYVGDYGSRLAEISSGELFKYNLDPSEVFFSQLEEITSDVSVTDTRATLASQLSPSPPPSGGNYSGNFTINGKTITVTGTDTLETLKNKINFADADVIAEIDENNKLVIKSQRSELIQMSNGTSNILTALGLQRKVEGTDIGSGITSATPLINLVPPLTAESIQIETDSGIANIDLSSAVTVGDVISLINNSNVGVEAFVNSSGTGLTIAATENTQVLNVSNLRAVFGSSIGTDLTEGTTLSSLGLTLGEIEVTNGSITTTVDLSSAQTIGDVMDLLKQSGAGVEVSINSDGTGISLVTLEESDYLEIKEVGVGTTAFDLGILGISQQNTASDFGIEGEGIVDSPTPSNIFDTILDFEDFLLNGTDTDEYLDDILTRLNESFDYLLRAQTRIGVRTNRLEAELLRLAEVKVQSTRLISLTEDADLAETVTQLTIQENVYTASLSAASRIISVSLLDFLQ